MVIAFLINDIQDGYQRMIWNGIRERVESLGIQCVTLPTRFYLEQSADQRAHNLLFQFLKERLVDGFIVSNSTFNGSNVGKREIQQFFGEFGSLPYVSVSTRMMGEPTVFVDNPSGLKELVSHFIEEHGFRKIGFIRGPKSNDEAESRFDTFCQEMKRHGLPVVNDWIAAGNFEQASGYAAMKEIWERPGEKPRAMLAANDNMIMGAYQYLAEERGVSVPGEVALGGYDDLPGCRFNPVTLSTVRQPIARQAMEAVDLLAEYLAHKKPPKDITLNTQAVYRASCSCLSGNVSFAGILAREAGFSDFLADATALISRKTGRDISRYRSKAYIERILAIFREISAGEGSDHEKRFIAALKGALDAASPDTEEMEGWMNILAALGHDAKDAGAEALAEINGMIGQGYAMVAEKIGQCQELAAFRAGTNGAILQSSLRLIMESRTLEEFFERLGGQLKPLRFNEFFLTFFDHPLRKTGEYGGKLPANSYIALQSVGGEVSRPAKKPFPTVQMLPDGMFARLKARNVIVQMVTYDDYPVGLMIAECKAISDDAFESLRAQISSSIRTGTLISFMEDSQRGLKEHNQSIESLIKPMIESIAHAMKAARENGESMESAVRQIEENKKTFALTSASVETIAENAKRMMDLIAMIDDISERINVLSINASIESARVGAAGKGFGVIAGEVRKLADSTSTNAAQTNETLKVVNKNIELAKKSSRESVETYHAMQERIGGLSRGLEVVMEQMESLNEKSARIMAMIQG